MRGCISLYSYIKPQLLVFHTFHVPVVYLYIPTSNHNLAGIGVSVAMLYIFIFLHQTTTPKVSSIFMLWLYIFIFLHQTTTLAPVDPRWRGCISLYSYIKPQHIVNRFTRNRVVYLYIPTSNHNCNPSKTKILQLYIFIFLHQTTTCLLCCCCCLLLYIFIFLHQTTTLN